MYVRIYVCKLCMYVCMHMCVCIHIHTYICVWYVCIYVFMCIMYIYGCTYIYVHILQDNSVVMQVYKVGYKYIKNVTLSTQGSILTLKPILQGIISRGMYGEY